jgi:predicted transcriptional regulator
MQALQGERQGQDQATTNVAGLVQIANPLREDTMDQSNKVDLVELTSQIICAYVGNNTINVTELPGIIADVHEALSKASHRVPDSGREELKPAIALKKSVTPDYIVCLEDGKKFKSLKRHLRTHYNLSPEEYREKWGLPHDYPMVAPNYAAARSQLAKDMGLGTRKEK